MTAIGLRLRDDKLRIFDVGARGGADERWNRFADCIDLIGFEPDPSECRRLNAEVERLPYPARFEPYALWRERREDLPFHVTRWEVASSVFPPNEEFLRDFSEAAALLSVKERRSVRATTLDDVIQERRGSPDYLKLDAEGAELDILLGGETAIEETLAIEVEVEFNPLFRGQPLFADVDAYLRDREWMLLGLRRNSWRRLRAGETSSGYGGQLVACDALYLRQAALATDRDLAHELKLLLILAAYRQDDLLLQRFADSQALRELRDTEARAIRAELIPRLGLAHRIARAVLRRMGSEERRRLSDSLQAAESPVWQDPNFF